MSVPRTHGETLAPVSCSQAPRWTVIHDILVLQLVTRIYLSRATMDVDHLTGCPWSPDGDMSRRLPTDRQLRLRLSTARVAAMRARYTSLVSLYSFSSDLARPTIDKLAVIAAIYCHTSETERVQPECPAGSRYRRYTVSKLPCRSSTSPQPREPACALCLTPDVTPDAVGEQQCMFCSYASRELALFPSRGYLGGRLR